MHAQAEIDINKPIIHLPDKGLLSLSQIVEMIVEGDDTCIDGLLKTIKATISATHLILHVQAVKRLSGRCTIIKGLILGRDFRRSEEILEAFKKIDDYAGIGIFPRLH